MRKILQLSRSFRDDEDGAAMIEYSVLIGIITIATIVTIALVGTWVSGAWEDLNTTLEANPTGT